MNGSKLNSILQAFSVQRYSLSVRALFSHVLAFCSLHYSVAVFSFRVAVLCVPSFLFPTARFLDHGFAQFSTVGQMKMVFYQKIVIFRNTNFLRMKYIYTQIYLNWKQVHCSFFFLFRKFKGKLVGIRKDDGWHYGSQVCGRSHAWIFGFWGCHQEKGKPH